ncbi:MAG: CocE/NonD family hydrolase [Anaerolineae bacterium]|jgi:hypothetical protein|nr:CocE/NonD family hydrolase [Anaerolineae bacterium]
MRTKSLIVERDVEMATRDGVTLRADVYRPAEAGPLPVLLQRTPYGKGGGGVFALLAAERGYTVVIQDTRGRWASDGDGMPFVSEKADGYDAVQWAAAQPWSNGAVGMWGASYVGYTQMAAASQKPAALKTIIPAVTFCDGYDLIYPGGAFGIGVAASWGIGAQAAMAVQRLPDTDFRKADLMAELVRQIDGMASRGDTFRARPLEAMPLIGKGQLSPFLAELLANPTRHDPLWTQVRVAPESLMLPIFHVGGWYDIFASHTLRDFAAIRAAGNTRQRVLMGPWLHGPLSGLVGEVDFGFGASDGALLTDLQQLDWFDRWLKGAGDATAETPPVRIFVMGANLWRDEDDWPLARAKVTPWFLHSGGAANTLTGDGTLAQEGPGDEAVDTFVYDPRNPVPTRGGGLCCSATGLAAGAFDQRVIEARPDVLVYTSAPLGEDLEVTGPIEVRLWAATSARDTDFTAKLVDVSPCGYARNVCDGVIRARHRRSKAEAVLVEPGVAYEYAIDLGPTSNLFKAGHRIRVEISSSNFPKISRNPNTGHAIGSDSELRPAVQTILHNSGYPSRVLLPVVA